MNDSDVLRRAAAVLRSAHDGRREGSGFTRARVLTTLAERRRPRRRRWLVLGPLGTLLLVGSAWAQSSGSWPQVWQAVASVLRIETSVSAPPRGIVARQVAPHVPRPSAAAPEEPAKPDVVDPEPNPPDVSASSPMPAPLPSPMAATPAHPPRAKASRPARGAAPPEPSRPEPAAADPELGQFRAAHELQVQGQRRAAIDAYAAYLRAYPQGKFVPEARYNTALDWIKLGDIGAARAGLVPFADGAYGGYRQQEARELLEALGSQNESPARR